MLMVLGLCYNVFLIRDKQVFREATTNSLILNALKTIFQILCIWVITLVVFPALIINAFEILLLESNGIKLLAGILFLMFSILGLYSSYTMVKNGDGTPLPIDQTQKLVTQGPYNYVRNPMAIAGIGQGISISIFFWSIHILIYSLLGAILWHFVVKPLEEKNMVERFGNEYLQYKRNVRCWIPTFK